MSFPSSVRVLGGTLGALLLTLPVSGWAQNHTSEEETRGQSAQRIQQQAQELKGRHTTDPDQGEMPSPEDPAPADIRAMRAMDDRILSRLSNRSRRYYERKMRQATVLFFDNNYQLALPLFKQIAARVKPQSLLYMYGLAAYRTNQSDLAIKNFQTMLKRDAQLHRVRMDLALAYIQKGDKEKAKLELARALEADMPADIRDRADSLLALLEGRFKRKKFSMALRLNTGIQYDDNINARSDDLPSTMAGTIKYYGSAVPVNVSADTLYFMGDKDKLSNLAWRTQLSGYHIDYFDTNDFDFSQAQFLSGPEYHGEKFRLRVPASIAHRQYGHKTLSNLWSVNPDITFSLLEGVDFKLGYKLDDETYVQSDSRNQTHTTHSVSGGPSWRLNSDRLQVLSLNGGYSTRDAETGQFSYDDWSIGPSYFTRFEPEIDLYLSAKYLDREYEGNTSTGLITVPAIREDDRYSATAMLSKTFNERYTLSATYSYINNDSNTSIYDYDKHVVGMNFGLTWNK